MRFIGGLSLLELLVTLVIVSVLLSLASPSFSQLIAEQRLRQAITELRISLMTARSEAVKRSQGVALIKSGSDWGTGWCVETGANATCSSQPIQQVSIGAEGITVAKDGEVDGGPLLFNALGRVSGCPEFTLTATAAGASCKLCLVVSTDGRVQSHSGDCPGECTPAGEAVSWPGSCS